MKLQTLGFALLLLACSRPNADGTTVTTTSSASPSSSSSSSAVETVPATCTSSGIKGNGQITRTKRAASGFVDVTAAGAADVEIKEGASFAVEVETDANVQDSITTVASGNTLTIGGKGSYCTNKLKVYVTLPTLHGAKVEGSGKIDATKSSAASEVALGVSGSGRVTFRGAATALTASVNGSGAIVLDTGSATATAATINGSGTVKKQSFTPGTVSKQVNGSGAVTL